MQVSCRKGSSGHRRDRPGVFYCTRHLAGDQAPQSVSLPLTNKPCLQPCFIPPMQLHISTRNLALALVDHQPQTRTIIIVFQAPFPIPSPRPSMIGYTSVRPAPAAGNLANLEGAGQGVQGHPDPDLSQARLVSIRCGAQTGGVGGKPCALAPLPEFETRVCTAITAPARDSVPPASRFLLNCSNI